MTSKERMLAAIRREEPDHVPLYSWVFGFTPPKHLRWSRDGAEVSHWCTGRMEHIHTLPEPWGLADDFRRVEAWLSLGVDDVLDVSVPWAMSDHASYRDASSPPGSPTDHELLRREYQTPDGPLTHTVRRTHEEQGEGWVIQPDHVPLFEDFNISRATHHLVSSPEDVARVRWLYCRPGPPEQERLRERMTAARRFAEERGVMVQAWSAFGVDAAVWMAGAEGAVILCMEHLDSFVQLLDIIHDADRARTELALALGADMVVARGWYSSTDFWSPRIFRDLFKPKIAELAALAHARGKLFGYTMTTGVMALGMELAEAGVDLLYYVDPVQDRVDLAEAAKRFRGRMAVAGGVNSSVTLGAGSAAEIRAAVKQALAAFGSGGGFVLSPVDALFPDTPAAAVETMIQAWREGMGNNECRPKK